MDVPTPRGPARTLFGRPLSWSTGWTVVLAVWALAAVLLAVARLDIGHVTALSAREAAAIDAVETAPATTDTGGGTTTAAALQLVLERYGGTAVDEEGRTARPQWYAIDRPWEGRVHVYWELGDYTPLAWTVNDDGTVTASAETQLLLEGLVRLEEQDGGP